MYIPTDLPDRMPKLRPTDYDRLAECNYIEQDVAISTAEVIIEAMFIYATFPMFQGGDPFVTISDDIIGDCCFELSFLSYFGSISQASLVLSYGRGCPILAHSNGHQPQHFPILAEMEFNPEDLPNLDDLVDFVITIDSVIGALVTDVLQSREDIVEMRALVYGEGW